MEERLSEKLSRLFVVSTVAIGALSAVFVWQLEHLRSPALTLVIAAAGIGVCLVVFAQTRAALQRLSDHVEASLRTADEQSRRAETANRLKDEFLATLSHELRTPLNAVLGWARLLDSGKLSAEQSVKAIQAIERAGWAQARIIEDLLDVSHIAGGRIQLAPRLTAVPHLLAGVVQSLSAGSDAKQVQIDVTVDPHMAAVNVDSDRVRQMLWHLIANAIKFTPAQGRIEVGARFDGQQLRLWVDDTGIGFEPTVATHLFERFRQGDSSTTRPYGGLGLGLGMVRHLAELHGGVVTACSAGPGRGARFDVVLPVRPAHDAASPDPVAGPSVSLRGIHVLVVDDDPGALSLMRATLERFGADVVTASSAAEALDCLDRRQPDVLLSDLRMPESDGLDLIRRVRTGPHTNSQIPAAAVTALARVEDRRRALEAGYQAHVSKPVDPLELAATVVWLTQRTSAAPAAAAEGH